MAENQSETPTKPEMPLQAYLQGYQKLAVWAVGTAVIPFVAALTPLLPPWPDGVVIVTAIVQLAVLVFVYQFARTSRRATKQIMRLAAIGLALGLVAYLVALSFLTTDGPIDGTRIVRGLACSEKAVVVYADACPLLPRQALEEAEFDPEQLWTLPSITLSRMILFGTWILFFVSLPAFLGSFLKSETRKAN